MSASGSWVPRLEKELARELGQTLAFTPGGEEPSTTERISTRITAPGTRLRIAADAADVAGFLIEARVIEAGQAEPETVRELWSGILASVASGMGGEASAGEGNEEGGETWTLQLGAARVRLRMEGEPNGAAAGDAAAAERPVLPAGGAAPLAMPRATGNFDLLLEVELDAAVRFGAREMELNELLELGPGDVVELDRQVADPVDLVVGDRIVARGEVVLVNGNFGLRVTEVAEPMRRLESIRCLW